MRDFAAVFSVGIVLSTGLAAQSTGLPSYNAPYRAYGESEKGVGASFPGGTTVAFEGFYGIGQNRWDVRFRGAISVESGPNNNTIVAGGVEFRQRVITHDEAFPADGAIVLGGGLTRGGGGTVFLAPIGLSLGRRVDVENSDVSIVPYVQPTIVLTSGDPRGTVLFTVGLGGDFRLTPVFDLRVGIGFGDIDGFSIGAVWLR